MTVDPDTPDPADRTMARLELTESLDECFPQWGSMVGQSQRDGWAIGWLDPDTPPAGALLAEVADNGQHEATALPWREEQKTYYVLRPLQAREVWTRVLPRYPATYAVEALMLTKAADPDNGVRRWKVLTADEQPVMLTDAADGGNPRPWLLREDVVYDITHDIEGRWEIWGQDATKTIDPDASRQHRA